MRASDVQYVANPAAPGNLAEADPARGITSLDDAETIIERGIQTFIEVGNALLAIRDQRLYQPKYASFEAYCRERWGMSRVHAHRHIEAARVGNALPFGNAPANEAQARELAPVLRDEGEEAVVEVFRDLREQYGDDVTAARVKRLVGARARQLQRERDAEQRAAEAPVPEPSSDVQIEHCDLRDLDVADASVDLIFTDPPYLASTLGEYDALADFAARVLRPGGMLVSYCGNVHALDCANRLARTLNFVTIGGIQMPGAHSPVHKYKLRVHLKPLLFFASGTFSPTQWWSDLFVSPKPDKEHHAWQQSEGDSGALIEAFTEPGDLVVDPFLGSGTTALVANRLGRRFVGCDIDASAVATAKRRLASGAGEVRL